MTIYPNDVWEPSSDYHTGTGKLYSEAARDHLWMHFTRHSIFDDTSDGPSAAERTAPPQLPGPPAMPDAAFLAIICGFLWLCLWRRRWRYAGVLPVIIGLAYPLYTAQPDVFIAEDGKQWMVRLDDDRFAAASLRREKFVLAQWQQRVGGVALVDAHDLNATEAAAPEDDEPDDDASVAASPAPAAVPTNLRCDALGCVYRHGAHSVAFATQPEATLEDCASATVVVAQIPLPAETPAT